MFESEAMQPTQRFVRRHREPENTSGFLKAMLLRSRLQVELPEFKEQRPNK